MPLRQQRHLEVRALGLCAFERGAQLWAGAGATRSSFFLSVGSPAPPYRYSYLQYVPQLLLAISSCLPNFRTHAFSMPPPSDQETAGPIERYLIHRANEAAVAAKPSMWDNLLRDLLPKSTPAAHAATKLQAHARAAKARRLSAAAKEAHVWIEEKLTEANRAEERRLEAAADVKAHELAEAKAKADAAEKAQLVAAAEAKAAGAEARLTAARREAEAKAVAAAGLEKARLEQAASGNSCSVAI